MEKAIDISKTVFIVSSKSGGTTEPNAMKDYFFARVVGGDRRQRRRATASSPSPIPARRWRRPRERQGFARVFHGEPSIGGRYSVLSPFGLVPAATAGIDVRKLITNALVDGALLRRRRAAARESRRAARACDGPRRPRRPRQGDDLLLAQDRRFRRLGRAADRRIHRQGRQGPDPDRWRAARRRPRLTATTASSSISAPRASRTTAHEQKLKARSSRPAIRWRASS